MKYTLANCINAINQILNYPSVDYSDISHFFDQAIAELNTSLHIGLRPMSEIYKSSTFKIESLGDFVMFNEAPTPDITKDETADVYLKVDESGSYIYYKYDDSYKRTKKLFGIYARYVTDDKNKPTGQIQREIYQTIILGEKAYWTPYEYMPDVEVNLIDYMPYNWITLFLIPYVCFKFAVRNGDSGALYADELTQGFQQLQTSYDIPCFSNLKDNADKVAYTKDVEEHLPNININIPTRAIYENMLTDRKFYATYGSMYDNGGWNI
jgi:hypothetical protein